MPKIGGTEETFRGTSEPLNYKLQFRNPNPMTPFSFKFGNSGVNPHEPEVTGVAYLSISGYEGKLYDNEGNYFHSYSTDQGTTIEGNIFPDYHNYAVDGILINSDCERQEGEINAFYYSGINLSNFQCMINEYYDPL